ncbi:hypothetical protein [Oceanibacterium hippocampi]|nr:hypothetical protein [Oceanibacterium hippocampi]
MTKRRQYKSEFWERVALEAVNSQKTVAELVSRFDLYPTMIHQWNKALLDGASDSFKRVRVVAEVDAAEVKESYVKIGELTVE